MGKMKSVKLYLAAYYWPDDEDCISYAQSKGYGIIQPNGADLTVHLKAKGKWMTISFISELTYSNKRLKLIKIVHCSGFVLNMLFKFCEILRSRHSSSVRSFNALQSLQCTLPSQHLAQSDPSMLPVTALLSTATCPSFILFSCHLKRNHQT